MFVVEHLMYFLLIFLTEDPLVLLIIYQTMNKVFEHAGDLVNIRVAHNLMRLIAEGFGEEDEGADSQLRSSAVCTLD
jgi:hypothetical protein